MIRTTLATLGLIVAAGVAFALYLLNLILSCVLPEPKPDALAD